VKIVIVGGGLIGITSAYVLSRRGHEVIVIERAQSPGLQTSFANGGLLTPSMAEPWNSPGSWRVLLASLGRPDSALQLRLRALPGLLGWGIRFLRNSRADVFARSTLHNLRLSLQSLQEMQWLRAETGIDYARAAEGTLRLFRSPQRLDQAIRTAEKLRPHGLDFRGLSADEAVQREPALAPIGAQLAGAIHYPIDESGDAYRFCVGLAECARQRHVEFHYGTTLTSFELRRRHIVSAITDQGRFSADRYIVATGSYSAVQLRTVGLSLPVRPVKGYSVSMPQSVGGTPLRIPVADDELHAVVTPLGGRIRAAGTAEFAGYDLAVQPARIASLLGLVGKILPRQTVDPLTIQSWCGLRAMAVDGVPIIGPTSISNLFVNTGHGHLGWTTAAASAVLMADLLCGGDPSLDPGPYSFARFRRTAGT
jgi:D-amino-acid dehydrogenase